MTNIYDWSHLNQKINTLIIFLWEKKKYNHQNPTIKNIYIIFEMFLHLHYMKHLQIKKFTMKSPLYLSHPLGIYLFLWFNCKDLNISENYSKLWELPSHQGNIVNMPRSKKCWFKINNWIYEWLNKAKSCNKVSEDWLKACSSQYKEVGQAEM